MISVSIWYLVLIFLSFLFLIILTTVYKETNPCYVLLFLTTAMVNISYWCISQATTAEEALLANKFTYLDGTLMPLFLTLCMCHICGIHVGRRVLYPVFAIDTVILGVVFTTEKTGWHYTSVELKHSNGVSYLAKEYGPFHDFYMYIVVIYMIIPLLICIYAFINRKKISYIYTLLLGFGQIFTVALFIIETALGLKIERLPLAYIVVEATILIIIGRTSLYDINQNIQLTFTQKKDHGYVILDKNRKYMGSDENARGYFPELNELSIDGDVDQPYLRHEFGRWIYESSEMEVEPKYIERDNKVLKVSVKPFFSSNGKKQRGYLMEITDDTQTREYINELERSNIRSEELAKEAQAANRAKSQFLSFMSHEIRTPINVILGMNDMVYNESRQGTIKEYSGDIKRSANMLLTLVNELLDFSRIESGKMELIENQYSFHELVEDVYRMENGLAQEKNLEFNLEVEDSLPAVLKGDEIKIKEILINIVTNAIKYTDIGSVYVSICSLEKGKKYSPGDKADIKITVQDTGRGIPGDDKNYIFEAFTRADESNNRKIEGTGLGMAITKKYVELMGGTIDVQSEYGLGSTFTVVIPQYVVCCEITEKTDSLPDDQNRLQKDRDLTGIRILAIDDVYLNLKMISLFLKDTGVELEMAGSGEDALGCVRHEKYDLILVDHFMPDMDGKECMDHIREDHLSKNRDVPIVVMTANAGAKEEYIEQGFSDYISKPFTTELLIETIKNNV